VSTVFGYPCEHSIKRQMATFDAAAKKPEKPHNGRAFITAQK
jgi:hypothetical protein